MLSALDSLKFRRYGALPFLAVTTFELYSINVVTLIVWEARVTMLIAIT